MSLLALLAAHTTPTDPPPVISDSEPGVPYALPSAAPWHPPVPAIVPTPDGTGSTVHPDVIDFGQAGWNGHRFWMAHTPYYGNNIQLENPCVAVSQDGYTWTEPAGVSNPIFPWPGSQWQSDTDLSYDPDTDELVLVWRFATTPRVSRSSDGITWSAQAPFTWPNVTEEQASPTLVRLGPGQWVAWTVQHPTRKLLRWTAAAPEGPWSGPTECTGGWGSNGNLWHVDVIRDDDGVFRLLMQEGWTTGFFHTGSSVDGINWTRNPTPILQPGSGGWDTTELYRGTIALHENGRDMRVWYSGRNSANSNSWRPGYTRVRRSLWPTI